MAQNKTQPTQTSVTTFLSQLPDQPLRDDCFALLEMMRQASQAEPVMWGRAIIGFGTRHYVYESGREGDTMLIGFSPRKPRIAIYLAGGLAPLEGELSILGKHQTGKGCLYVQRLRDVNPDVLRRIFAKAFSLGLHQGLEA